MLQWAYLELFKTPMFCKFMGHATLPIQTLATTVIELIHESHDILLHLVSWFDISCSPGLFENGWYHYTFFLDFKMQWNFPFYSFENGVPPKQTPVLDINSKLIQEALTWMRQNRNLQESNVGGMSLQAPYAPERQNGDSDFCNPAIIPTRNGKFDWLW